MSDSNKKSTHSIPFYLASEIPYGKFSNYHVTPFRIGTKHYESVEHYYQSQKYTSTCPEFEEQIILASTPHQSKMMSRQILQYKANWQKKINEQIRKCQQKWNHSRPIPCDPKWEEIKDDIMKKGLRAKFSQHIEIQCLLKDTGNAYLFENSPIDYYWGCGKDGTGKNKLGYMLMELRQELLDKDDEDSISSTEYIQSSQSSKKLKTEYID